MIQSKRTGRYRNIGLLILRLGLGSMFILHGYPKFFGGPEMWTSVGSAMGFLGIDFSPMFFGFMAGVAEFFGGIFILLGLFFRPALVLVIMVMVVATAKHLGMGDSFSSTSHSIEMAIVFTSLLFIGAGKYSLDNTFTKRRTY